MTVKYQIQDDQDSNPNKPIQFFAKRQKIYPRSVSGKYRRLKWMAILFTLGIYYLVPFIRWDRGPNAPSQAVLIDLPARRAYWFFMEIWPQEVYYLTAILIFAAITLFFVTSLFGRVWCGYFCPQTVWTDLFVWTEKLIQGDRNVRKKLQEGPWTFEKIWKVGLTHFIWLCIAWCTAGSFVLYFNDAPTLVKSFFELNVSPTVLGFIGALTFSTYLMAGFTREQVCIYMCPYSRFQSAMFDRDTLVIGYDQKRGEPRGNYKKNTSWENRGHCIDCSACVQVCPMGIDIRNGLQLECIACGLCIDACNAIMDKVSLPHGLIRYDTENNIEKRNAGDKDSIRIIRPRTIYYAAILLIVFAFVVYSWVTRPMVELHVLPDRNPLYVLLSDGHVRNGYDIRILNKQHDHRTYSLTIKKLKHAQVTVKDIQDVDPGNIVVPADTVGHFHVFIKAERQHQALKSIVFELKDNKTDEMIIYNGTFVSGEQND